MRTRFIRSALAVALLAAGAASAETLYEQDGGTWIGECSGGFAEGRGTLRWVFLGD